jgi:hypothetical protein
MRLSELPDARRVAFDVEGRSLPIQPTEGHGPAVMLVSEVTEAVKEVSGDRVTGAVDRDDLYRVVGFELDRRVIDQLAPEDLTAEQLIVAVEAMGHVWEPIPHSS